MKSDSWLTTDLVPAVLTGVAGTSALALSLLFRNQLPIPAPAARPLGFFVLYGGMALFLWASYHLKDAIRGLVRPRLDYLVVSGPYRFVRHPSYLGMTVAMIGVGIVARSVLGLAASLLLFLPVEVHRARLEERALEEKFGQAWLDYTSKTSFLLPRLGRGTRD